MKRLLVLLCCIATLSCAGQEDLKKIVKTFKIPKGWKGEVILDSSYVPMFGKRMVARWHFQCTEAKIQPVELFIFAYDSKDSAAMAHKSIMYYATSNCLVASNENIKQNSMDFVRGNYYFVERMCPCYTTGSEDCRTFVRALSDWMNNRDKSKEF